MLFSELFSEAGSIGEMKAQLQGILKQIREQYKVELNVTVSSRDKVFIEFIGAGAPGQGAFALQEFTDWADKNKVKIGLLMDTNYGSRLDQLMNFYGHFGFKPIIREMERNPK